MRAILIDPKARTIAEIDVEDGDGDVRLEALQRFVGGHIEAAYVEGACVFVNEEGLFEPEPSFFYWEPHTLAGPAVVVSAETGPEGETLACTLTLDEVAAAVRWPIGRIA